jgi:hypothetical protein
MVSYKNQELLTIREHLRSPTFFGGSVVLILFLNCVLSYYVALRSELRVVMSVTISA